MYESGDWIVPKFNGELRSHKPALLYWLQVGAYSLFGINEFAARLPSALAALATVLLAYELGRRLFNPIAGLLSGLILGSSALFCAAAHFANPDSLLVTFTTATLTFFWLGFSRGRRAWWLASGVAAGFGVLAKGPVGFVLPAAVIVLFLVWAGQWRLLFGRVWIHACLLCGLVALPWYVLVTLDTKREFLADFLLNHNLERALNPMEQHGGPPWYYIAVVVLGLGTWSVFVIETLWFSVWSMVREPRPAFARQWSAARDGVEATVWGYRFLACWTGLYLVAFTLAATKLPNYILPVFAPCAILMGRTFDRWCHGEIHIPAWGLGVSLALLALVGVGVGCAMLVAGGAIPLSVLRGRVAPDLNWWAAVGLAPIVAAGAGAWCLKRQRRSAFMGVLLVASVVFLAPLAAGATVAVNALHAPRPLVQEAHALVRTEDVRIGSYQLDFLASINFYVQRNVRQAKDEKEVIAMLREPLPTFIFLSKADWAGIAPRVASPWRVAAVHTEMYRAGEVVVVTNR
jgi:4-amino-4-deoxy-L-arabinose transferase-like glycosyltransferase